MTTTPALEQYQDRPDSILQFLDQEQDPSDLAQNRLQYLDRMEEKYQREPGMTKREARAIAATKLVDCDVRAITLNNRNFSQRVDWPGPVTEALDAMHQSVFGTQPNKPGGTRTHSPELQKLLSELEDGNPEGITISYGAISEIYTAINLGEHQKGVEETARQAFNQLEDFNTITEVIQQVQEIREQAGQNRRTALAPIANRFLQEACNGLQSYLNLGGGHLLRYAKQQLRIGLTLMIMDRT